MSSANPLFILGKLLQPPARQTFDGDAYPGLEYKWKAFVFRPALFKLEAYFLGVILAYFLWSYVGKALNRAVADKWAKWWKTAINDQVALINTFENGSLVLSDGSTDFLTYATGRRGLRSVHGHIHTKPRHDLFQSIYELAYALVDFSFESRDCVTLDFTLAPCVRPEAGAEFVWALARKSGMAKLRKSRWDLTFTKVLPDTTLLPASEFSTMSELPSVNDELLKGQSVGIVQALSDADAARWLNYLIITDQPTERPSKGPLAPADKSRHLIVNLILPSGNPSVVAPVVDLAFNLVDVLHKGLPVAPDTLRKLRKTRTELDVELQKEYENAQKEDKEADAPEDKRRAQKRALEEAKLARMTPEQRRKHEEKERARALRKQQSKMTKRR